MWPVFLFYLVIACLILAALWFFSLLFQEFFPFRIKMAIRKIKMIIRRKNTGSIAKERVSITLKGDREACRGAK